MPRHSTAAQLALPLEPAGKVERVLEAIDTARQRALDLLEPIFRPRPDLSLVPTRPDGSRIDQKPYEPNGDWTLVERKGRVGKDGVRRGARILRRTTIYFEPLVHEELETYCAMHKLDMSEFVNEVVRHVLDRQ